MKNKSDVPELAELEAKDIMIGSFSCARTLKSRFLDRWLCIPCYKQETALDKASNEDIHCKGCGRDWYEERPDGIRAKVIDHGPWVAVCVACGGLRPGNHLK